jgi:hypothetical protein
LGSNEELENPKRQKVNRINSLGTKQIRSATSITKNEHTHKASVGVRTGIIWLRVEAIALFYVCYM